MNRADTQVSEEQTAHGLLIAFGEFGRETGLVAGLMGVRIPQKVHRSEEGVPPPTKLVELLAGILTGIEYLQDLSLGAHPIASDQAVVRAWGQGRFVHYSNVSRTLAACNATSVQDVRAVCERFSQPFIAEAVSDELRAGRALVFDVDLMGQPVSATSRTYPGVAFGWMDNQVRLGYQLARVCVQSERYGRIWLDGFHHAGDTVSVSCLQELILAAEQQAGVRPRRRVELVVARIAGLQPAMVRVAANCAQHTEALTRLDARRTQLEEHAANVRHQLVREANPVSKSHLSRNLATIQRQLLKLDQQRAQRQTQLARRQARLAQIRTEEEHLCQWQAHLEAENQLNPNAPVCICRSDAGFCSVENVIWLLEMGYQLTTKATSAKLTQALRKRCSDQTTWTPVGQNAEMVAWDDYQMKGCLYPLRVGLQRFRLGHQIKYSTLLTYRDDLPAPLTLPAWFAHYNARQTIEAGNKQMKTVYHLQHLMSRSPSGIQIQVLLTGLACNLTQFIQPWLQSAAACLTPALKADLSSPKTMVRIMANSTATVQRTPVSTVLVFDQSSSVSNLKLCLHGYPLHQLSLRLFQPSSVSG